MLHYLIRRLLMAVVTLLAISVISFVIIQLPPGDYIDSYVAAQTASGAQISMAEADALRAEYGLDQPFWIQYLKWMNQIAHGNLGTSMAWHRPVSSLIGERLALTVVLTLATVVFTWLIAFPIGIYSAVKQYSVLDYVATFLGFFGLAVPNFLLALVLMYLGFALFDANIGGLFSPEYANAPWTFARSIDLLKHLPIPAIVLALSGTAEVIRVMRANLLDELGKPYVVTARAKGLTEWQVILRHPVRVALNPFISTIGYILPYIVSGSIIVSLVLSLPTVGPLLLQALLAQDMFLAGAIVLLLGALTVAGTLISDLLLMWIDPRVRSEI
jgi:peptide/nickel transport system permease protein